VNVTSMEHIFRIADASAQDITGWSYTTVSGGSMFSRADAWLAKFVRKDGSGKDSGPPSLWQFPALTQSGFTAAVAACLETHPVDGLCVDNVHGPMPGWDVSDVTNMKDAFTGKSTFNADISGWNTQSVADMQGMFLNGAAFAKDILGWSTLALSTSSDMFSGATAWLAKLARIDGGGSVDGPPSLWKFPPLTQDGFQAAVAACLETHPVDGLCVDNDYGPMPRGDVSDVTDMSSAFNGKSTFSADITGWTTPALSTALTMFGGATAWLAKFDRKDGSGSVDGPPSLWQFPPLTQSTFADAVNACLATHPVDGLCVDSMYGPMPGWDVSAVTDMSGAFSRKSVFNGDIIAWDTSSVTDMNNMFNNALAFNQPFATWDTSSVTDMSSMFSGAQVFNQPIGDWVTSSVTDMHHMFYKAEAFDQPLGAWDTSSVTKMSNMF